MSSRNSHPRGRQPESLDDLLTEIVAEAWAAGLASSEDVGWKKAGAVPADESRTLMSLQIARDDSRRLLDGSSYDDGNEFAIGAAENRVNYVVGEAGLKYEAIPISREGAELVGEVQVFIDAFCELNCMPEVEAESLARGDRDGEAFHRLFKGKDIPEVRFIEPECVRPPDGDVDLSRCKWGVLTGSDERPRDQKTVSGYYVDDGDGPLFVPECEIVHLKMNVDSRFPRGWPTFEPVARALRRSEELLVAMTATGKARAKIALVESIPGLTREKADNLVNKLTSKWQDDPSGGPPKLQTVEDLPYGARVRVREGTTITFPNHALGAADLIEAIQANLRAAGARLVMPEWMFTLVADAKYSNAFVVEAPTLKSFKRIQRKLVSVLGEGRMGQRASLVWRAIRMGVASGILNPAVLRLVKIKCTGPTLEVRDKASEASENATYITAGVKPVQLVQQELGYDPLDITALVKKYSDEPTPDNAGGGELKGTVGGLQAILQLQTAYYGGAIPRAAAVAMLVQLFGFIQVDAEKMFPPIDPVKRTEPTVPAA